MTININKDCGLTSVFSRVVKISDAKTDERLLWLMQEYAKLATARTHPHKFKEIEQYFLEQCDALPLPSNDNSMNLFKASVIMDRFKDKEYKAPIFSDMTQVEISKWHKEKSNLFYEANLASPEQYGLNLHGYYLPYTKRNEVFYDEVYSELMKYTDQLPKSSKMEDICFFFEETTGEYYFTCVGCSLMYQVIIFIGVSEDDIKKCNQRFVTYMNAMVQMGYWHDFC